MENMKSMALGLGDLQKIKQFFGVFRVIDPYDGSVVLEHRRGEYPAEQAESGPWVDALRGQCLGRQEAVFRVENSGGRLLLLIAIPVTEGGRKLVVEFVKDITGAFFLEGMYFGGCPDLMELLDQVGKMALTDELTGLHNRRYIDQKLPGDITVSEQRRQPFSLIFTDIDHFKRVNDTYGHAAGDRVLLDFGEELRRNTRRDVDWVARYGGEEFIVFLGNTEAPQAREIAERIRVAVMEKEFRYRECAIRVTCSLGVYTLTDFTLHPTVDDLVDAIDRKLYRAKSLGRNLVV